MRRVHLYPEEQQSIFSIHGDMLYVLHQRHLQIADCLTLAPHLDALSHVFRQSIHILEAGRSRGRAATERKTLASMALRLMAPSLGIHYGNVVVSSHVPLHDRFH